MKIIETIISLFIKRPKEKYVPVLKVKTVDFFKNLSTKERLGLYFEEAKSIKENVDLHELEKLTKRGASQNYPLINNY
jgi:hypothetical protein